MYKSMSRSKVSSLGERLCIKRMASAVWVVGLGGHLVSEREVNNPGLVRADLSLPWRAPVWKEQHAYSTLCGENVKALAAMATRQLHGLQSPLRKMGGNVAVAQWRCSMTR